MTTQLKVVGYIDLTQKGTKTVYKNKGLLVSAKKRRDAVIEKRVQEVLDRKNAEFEQRKLEALLNKFKKS